MCKEIHPLAGPALNTRKLAILLQSGDPERVRNVASMIAGAAALNWEVVLVLFGEALESHVLGRLDPPEAGQEDPGRPSALIRSAVEFGRVTILACSADARRSGLSEGLIKGRVDDILGMTTILRRIQDAGTKLWV